MAAHSSILAWKIPWTEESGGLQSMVTKSQTRLRVHARRMHDVKTLNVWGGAKHKAFRICSNLSIHHLKIICVYIHIIYTHIYVYISHTHEKEKEKDGAIVIYEPYDNHRSKTYNRYTYTRERNSNTTLRQSSNHKGKRAGKNDNNNQKTITWQISTYL